MAKPPPPPGWVAASVQGLKSEAAEPKQTKTMNEQIDDALHVQGVSTRRVTKAMEELCGFEVSSGQVSNLNKQLDEEFAKWRSRLLPEIQYLILDATYYPPNYRLGLRISRGHMRCERGSLMSCPRAARK